MDKRNRQMAKRERRPGASGRSVLGMACAMGLAALLSSCMHDDTPPCEMSPEDGYTLNVRLSAGSLATRAEGDGTSPGTGAENFINIGSDDYAVFILDQDGRYVQRFELGSVSLKTTAQGNNVYDLRGFFRPAETMTSIQLMVAANWETDFGYSYNEFESVLKNTDTDASTLPEQIYANENIIFTLPTDGGTSWVPDAGDVRRTGIPMFGMMSAPVALDRSDMTTDIPGEIPMLRSLAKIEIRDMVEGKSADITKCVLTKYNTKGRFIPDGTKNPDWNVDAKQVGTPSLPSDAVMIETGLTFAQGKREVTINGKEYKGDEAKDYFVVYVPEMDLTAFEKEGRPVIEVYLKDATEPSAVIELADYNGGKEPEREDGKDPYYTNLLRNHSYNYSVEKVTNGITAEVTLHLSSWDVVDDQDWYEYNDLAPEFSSDAFDGVGGGFKWTTFEMDSDVLDEPNTLIVSRSGGAEGRFALTEPNHGTWTLALYGADDTLNDAFHIEIWGTMQVPEMNAETGEETFREVDGWMTGSDLVTGPVDGSEVKFRIVATQDADSEISYKARLAMTITTFDGRILELNLPYYHNEESGPMTPPTVENGGYFYVKQNNVGF